MPNKHFCQGPSCHEKTTQDRFLKSRGVVRGRYASTNMDHRFDNGWYNNTRGKFFCSQSCEHDWLNEHMENIEQGRPIEFIRHRRESGGYEKTTRTHENNWSGGTYTTSQIERINGTDN